MIINRVFCTRNLRRTNGGPRRVGYSHCIIINSSRRNLQPLELETVPFLHFLVLDDQTCREEMSRGKCRIGRFVSFYRSWAKRYGGRHGWMDWIVVSERKWGVGELKANHTVTWLAPHADAKWHLAFLTFIFHFFLFFPFCLLSRYKESNMEILNYPE